PRSRVALLSFPTRRSSDLAFAGLFERRLRLRESRVRLLDACPGLPGRGVEGAERETTLLERVGPLALLRGLGRELAVDGRHLVGDRKSTRLNSSHQIISYA